MNLAPNNIIQEYLIVGSVGVNSTTERNNYFNAIIKRIFKNNFIFYGLISMISLHFLIYTRDLVKKNLIHEENKKIQLVLERETLNHINSIRMLQAYNSEFPTKETENIVIISLDFL